MELEATVGDGSSAGLDGTSNGDGLAGIRGTCDLEARRGSPATAAARLRELIPKPPGACVFAVVEQVGAMPGQGSSSTIRFGQVDGPK